MTKKEVKMIKEVILTFDEVLFGENADKVSKEEIANLTARKDVLEWLLEKTGNL